jgi:hypothetical protein
MLTVVKLARATGGNTTRNIEATLLTATVEQRIGSVAMLVSSRAGEELAVVVVSGEPVVRVGLAELAVPVAQVEPEALAGLEDQVVPAVRAALVVPENQVAPAELADQVAPVALANRVAVAELERDRVAVVPERDPAVVRVRTKLVIAAHRRGLVLLHVVEDLAVAAGTTREPAVTGVVVAWAAAVIAVVVADGVPAE